MNKGEDQSGKNRQPVSSRAAGTEKRTPQRRPVSREERMRPKERAVEKKKKDCHCGIRRSSIASDSDYRGKSLHW